MGSEGIQIICHTTDSEDLYDTKIYTQRYMEHVAQVALPSPLQCVFHRGSLLTNEFANDKSHNNAVLRVSSPLEWEDEKWPQRMQKWAFHQKGTFHWTYVSSTTLLIWGGRYRYRSNGWMWNNVPVPHCCWKYQTKGAEFEKGEILLFSMQGQGLKVVWEWAQEETGVAVGLLHHSPPRQI